MKARVDEKGRIILSSDAKRKLRLREGDEFDVIPLSNRELLLTAKYGLKTVTEFTKEIKKVAMEMGIKEEKSDKTIDPLTRKDGITGCNAEKIKKFHEFKTDFEATGTIRGKVMMSRLCSCECEGYVIVRLYSEGKTCIDYENCIDLYCFNPFLQCLNLKPGDWIEAEIDVFGTLKETDKKEIWIPPANESYHYKMIGRLVDKEINLKYFKLKLEDKLPVSDYVELDCCIHIDITRKFSQGMNPHSL